jgi:hypothetical protein
MLKALYEFNRKSRKWWHRIFWYFLDVTVVNAFIIYKEQTNDMKKTLMKFRLSLVTGLIGAKTNTPTRAKNLQIYPAECAVGKNLSCGGRGGET